MPHRLTLAGNGSCHIRRIETLKKRVMDMSHTIFATSSCEHPGDARSRGGWVCMTPPPSRSLQGVFRYAGHTVNLSWRFSDQAPVL